MYYESMALDFIHCDYWRQHRLGRFALHIDSKERQITQMSLFIRRSAMFVAVMRVQMPPCSQSSLHFSVFLAGSAIRILVHMKTTLTRRQIHQIRF